jgi:hypothetical protein
MGIGGRNESMVKRIGRNIVAHPSSSRAIEILIPLGVWAV